MKTARTNIWQDEPRDVKKSVKKDEWILRRNKDYY
jgi:hypothetical protein